MAEDKSFKSSKISKAHKKSKATKILSPSLVALASATRALRKITPSSQTLQSLLSSATLMHPEILPPAPDISSPLAGTDSGSQQSLTQQSLATKPPSPLPLKSESSSYYAEDHTNAKTPSQSTISSQRHLTFPQTNIAEHHSQASLDLPRTENPWPTQTAQGIGQGTFVNDSIRLGIENLLRTFLNDPINIHGSQMIHRHDIAPMVELHILAWREDRFVRRLQCNQIPRAEVQAMRTMLGDRTTSALDNVLVARINNTNDPVDIVAWLSCSIIRFKTSNRQVADENEIRAMDWNLATAANLNKSYNAGNTTVLFGDSKSLAERNYLIEVLCKGTRWSQRTEFRDQDFIAITNLVIHPNYPERRTISKQLILEARNQGLQLGMPIYVSAAGEYCAHLYKDECGFTEIGEHVSMMFEPEVRWKYLVYGSSQEGVELVKEQRGPSRFDFGWSAIKSL